MDISIKDFEPPQSEYVYLLREREFIRSKEQIYKIGKTKQSSMKRFSAYPKHSTLLLYIECDDCSRVEKEIMKLFKQKYEQCNEIGNEYFQGDPILMINDICQIVVGKNTLTNPNCSSDTQNVTTRSLSNNDVIEYSSHDQLTLSNSYNELEREYKDLHIRFDDLCTRVNVFRFNIPTIEIVEKYYTRCKTFATIFHEYITDTYINSNTRIYLKNKQKNTFSVWNGNKYISIDKQDIIINIIKPFSSVLHKYCSERLASSTGCKYKDSAIIIDCERLNNPKLRYVYKVYKMFMSSIIEHNGSMCYRNT